MYPRKSIYLTPFSFNICYGLLSLSFFATSNPFEIDINSFAIEYIKNECAKRVEHISAIKISFKVSDLYSNIDIKEKFDTIIFNPPYLPEDEFDNEKLITTGGKEGWEIVEKFLTESKNYLNVDGQILLLFSSLTNKDKKIVNNTAILIKEFSEFKVQFKNKNDILKGR